jgi:rubredoxin
MSENEAGDYVCGACGLYIPKYTVHFCGVYSVISQLNNNWGSWTTCPHCGHLYPNCEGAPAHHCEAFQTATLSAISFGWRCPVCSTVWAPHVQRCDECSPPQVSE